MVTSGDDIFLRRALRLAMNGRGHVEPNPMVGCVLVKNGQIIGEGWHRKVGEAHAEPNALADCVARGNTPEGATAYVTLEPCCHTNKRTPPCAPRLIEAKAARVVIGCLDPNPDVNGNGVAMLRDAGVQVDALPDRGMGYQPMASDAVAGESRAGSPCSELKASHFRQLVAPFILRQNGLRPYVTLKWAETADGKVSGPDGVPLRITNPTSTREVHRLRTRCDAIVVGVNTVLADDPMLTVRGVDVIRVPLRVVLDSKLRIPLNAKLVRTAGDVPTLVLSRGDESADPGLATRAEALRELGVVVRTTIGNTGDRDLLADIQSATSAGAAIVHAMVEPGPTLARDAMARVADRLWIFRSSVVAGSAKSRVAPVVPAHYVPTATRDLAGDTLTEYLNTRSPAFFAAAPSADFVLAAESAAAK